MAPPARRSTVGLVPTGPSQPIQNRLEFVAPTAGAAFTMLLSGLSVLVEPDDGAGPATWAVLDAAGVEPVWSPPAPLSFPVSNLERLAHATTHATIRVTDDLDALWTLACRLPERGGIPATVAMGPDGELTLSWFDGRSSHDLALTRRAAAALLHSSLPFVATADAWDVLRSTSSLPPLAGTATANLDGYVEVTTTKPQLVEAADVPGLFRLTDTRFGVAAPYAHHLTRAGGFVWEGPPPTPPAAPAVGPGPVELSPHSASDVGDLVAALVERSAQAVVWAPGLGRRVFALAAVDALEAWPALIVCAPSEVWLWQRHLDMFGRSVALTHTDADVHIVTFNDLVHRTTLPTPAAIIFDGLCSPAGTNPDVRRGAHRLDSVLDAYRIAVESTWPTSLDEQCHTLSLLRPGEFRDQTPTVTRYPAPADRRATEHVALYVSQRSAPDAPADTIWFPRSSVRTVAPTRAQIDAFDACYARPAVDGPYGMLAQLLDISSAGPSMSMSPKVAAAADLARTAAGRRRSVAVLCRSARTANLLRQMLRPLPTTLCDTTTIPAPVAGEVAVVTFDGQLGDLRTFDEVVVVDYPWSSRTLDRAVGSSAEGHGPAQVTVVHAAGTVDDRLAMLAARRRELGAVGSEGPPTPDEVNHLLAGRPTRPAD